ncbi:MAG: T9SS type A sorting domain-containing protein [Bacteroidetes bacterium]|nr:T9SS type A sorting domain-containing protein [Bacteroidota bacterium]
MCGHIGYMRWWFKHLPHYAGITDSILNNWWHYAIDYYEAVALAKKSMIVGVEDHGSNMIPDEFKLEQNYPNPFNSTTTIEYRLKKDSLVKMKVFDVLGRKVATLVDELKPAGSYRLEFNASRFSSGVYFYTLKTDKFIQTKKWFF